MAKEKKPSIYSDRGTIGSSEELDEYGVWVKSGPQDLFAEGVETPELSGDDDMDFAIPEIEDLPDFDSIDEKLSDDFSSTEIPEADFAIPDIGSDSETTEGVSDDLGLGDLAEETEFDSIDIPDLEESTDSGGLDNSVELTGLELTDIELTDIELTESELTDTEESGLENDFDFPEIDDQENLSLDVDISETENNDEFSGASIDDTIDDSMDDLIEGFDLEAEALSDGSVELDSGAVDEEYVPSSVQIQTEPQTETSFPTETGPGAASSSSELSTQLLMRIAEELSSIRVELSSLKKEFSGIRAAAPSAETEEGGFFDKEDDEKISLTGDELNNILNTADFTEETGKDVAMGLSDDDAGEPDLLTGMDTEIDADSTDLDLPKDIDFTEETVSGFSEEGTEENEGEPVTHDLTTEDTNYLAKTPAAEEEESIELEEVAIDELDLSLEEMPSEDISSEIQDNQIQDSLTQDSLIQDSLIEETLQEDLSVVNLEVEEPVSEDVVSEEFDNIGITSDELGNLEIAAEELAIEVPSIEVPSIEEPSIEEPGAESYSAEEPGTEELSILELGAENFDTEEPVFEELGPEPVEEEPVSEELAPEPVEEEPVPEELAPEPAEEEPVPEEDFGIIVVDEPGEKIEEAEEVQKEVYEEVHEEEHAQEAVSATTEDISGIPKHLKQELKTVLSYMDQLLEALPDEKIEEFARSEYYDTYKKLFKDLGIA